MSYNAIKKTFDIGDGRMIEIETGKLAKQADGSVVVRMGDTMLLATVVSTVGAKAGVDFLPLSVDYQEKYAATGRIPGGFLRREARLSDYEVLISRIVDRALRPQFPDDYHADTQLMLSLISSDNLSLSFLDFFSLFQFLLHLAQLKSFQQLFLQQSRFYIFFSFIKLFVLV